MERTRLFLAVVEPHKPVSSSTLARWLKSLFGRAGIDTGIFKGHSVRGAATSAAANAGVSMSDILNAADWSSESVFCYKPVHSGVFGVTVLSNRGSNGLPQLIWRPSLLKYNYRMAQLRPAILDYMRKVRSNISMSHPFQVVPA